MTSNTAPRDPILASGGIGGGEPKRADKLNDAPKTKSISGGGANYSSVSPKDKNAPFANNPYK